MIDFAIEVLGWVAAALSATLLVPQLLRVRAMIAAGEPPLGVSPLTAWMALANGVLWAVWAVAVPSYPAGAPSLVGVPVAALTIVALSRARRTNTERAESLQHPADDEQPTSERCPCGWPDRRIAHELVVAIPPGRGSVLLCHGDATMAQIAYPRAVAADGLEAEAS